MNKKIIVGVSAACISAVFWACGEGAIEAKNSEHDGFIEAMLGETNDFGKIIGSQSVEQAIQSSKEACAVDPECLAKMGAITPTNPVNPGQSSGSTPQPIGQSSSSGPIGGGVSSYDPLLPLVPASSNSNSGSSAASSASNPVAQSSASLLPVVDPGDGAKYGSCAPAKNPINKGESVKWNFSRSPDWPVTNAMTASYTWTTTGGSPATVEGKGASGVSTPAVAYAASGAYNASVKIILADGSAANLNCTPLQVNGSPITGCVCAPTKATMDVAEGTATWTVSGCTTSGSIVGYEWTGAAGGADGSTATAALMEKGQVISPSVVVSNDDNTKQMVACSPVDVVDATKPDYILDGSKEAEYTVGPGIYTMVYACKTDAYYQTPVLAVAPADGSAASGTVNGKAFSVPANGQTQVFSSQTPNTTLEIEVKSGNVTFKCG